MKNLTTGKLSKVLNLFPEDTPIKNEISLIWEFPDEISYDTLESMMNAMSLCIYEGTWEEGTVETFNKNSKKDTEES